MDNNYTTTAVVIGGLTLLRILGGSGIPLLVIPRYKEDICTFSRYFKSAGITMEDMKSDPRMFLSNLIAISKTLDQKPILYYGDDIVLHFVVNNKEELLRYYRFAVPDKEIMEACFHKYTFIQLAQKHGLPIPRSLASSKSLDCKTVEEYIGYPCVFKPDTHIGWFESEVVKKASNMPQKVILVNHSTDCAQALLGIREFTDRFIIQEFISGDEDEIYSFHAYVTQSGSIEGVYVGKKIRTYPSMGGESSYVRLVKNKEVVKIGLQIVEILKITGVVKIDFKKDVGRDCFYILEINLRFNLWNYLGARAGINLAEISYRDHCDLPIPANNDYTSGLHWLNFSADMRSFIKDYRPTHQLTIIQWIRSIVLKPKIYSVFTWSDPIPFIVTLYRSLKRYALKIVKITSLKRPNSKAI